MAFRCADAFIDVDGRLFVSKRLFHNDVTGYRLDDDPYSLDGHCAESDLWDFLVQDENLLFVPLCRTTVPVEGERPFDDQLFAADLDGERPRLGDDALPDHHALDGHPFGVHSQALLGEDGTGARRRDVSDHGVLLVGSKGFSSTGHMAIGLSVRPTR
ncbi:hypothetical protein A6V29_12785 [Blastococcus sp. CCUG 61487]|nr:hypothetical protein A6V29_12785 [Blastococcus sp. CCUG 61487]